MVIVVKLKKHVLIFVKVFKLEQYVPSWDQNPKFKPIKAYSMEQQSERMLWCSILIGGKWHSVQTTCMSIYAVHWHLGRRAAQSDGARIRQTVLQLKMKIALPSGMYAGITRTKADGVIVSRVEDWLNRNHGRAIHFT